MNKLALLVLFLICTAMVFQPDFEEQINKDSKINNLSDNRFEWKYQVQKKAKKYSLKNVVLDFNRNFRNDQFYSQYTKETKRGLTIYYTKGTDQKLTQIYISDTFSNTGTLFYAFENTMVWRKFNPKKKRDLELQEKLQLVLQSFPLN